MIHLFGDVWLGKIATLLREFYPEEPITFTDENQDKAFDPAALPEGTTLVLGSGAGAGAGAGKSAIIVPRALIDGLSSLEILGNALVGGEYLPEHLSETERNRAFALITRGEFDFHCPDRLAQSLKKIASQGPIGKKLAKYIDTNCRERRLISGIDRPDPILTYEATRLVADALGLDTAKMATKDRWRIDQVAYRQSTRVLVPVDADLLGWKQPLDSCWVDSIYRILQLAYGKDDQRRPSLHEDTTDAAQRRAWVKERVKGKPVSALADLLRLQKQGEPGAVVQELDRLLEQFAHIPVAQKDTVRLAVLRWFSRVGRAREAVDAVLKSGKPLSPMISKKVINTAANHLDAESISQVLLALKDREDFSEAASVRLTRFRDLVLRRHKAK